MQKATRIRNENRARLYRRLLVLYDLSIISWSLVVVELGLVWNSVSRIYAVSSTGQVIPFLIGLLGLLRNLNLLIVAWISKV